MKTLLLACLLMLAGQWAQAQSSKAYPAPQAPEIEARAYLLMDTTADQVLASKNAHQPVEPASLTKLMAAYLVFDALQAQKISLQQRFPVSIRAWKMEGSRMFIDPKMTVPVEELIKGMIVQSGNDATIALAEGVGGTVERFVELMNERARLLGMTGTAYKNPEGLTQAGHTTTAQDLAVLATRLMRDFPQFVHYYALQKYRLKGSPKSNDTNRNKLLFRDSTKTGFVVDGLKTGHTDAAGYCLVATSKRQTPAGERRLLSIVLGTTSENARADESEKLFVWGYNAFETVQLFAAKQAVLTPRIWKGAAPHAAIGLASGAAIVVAVPSGTGHQISTAVLRSEPLLAPITTGQILGNLKISLNGQEWRQIRLQALVDVPTGGWFSRLLDTVRLWWR